MKSLQTTDDDKTCLIEEVQEKQGIMQKKIFEKESELLKLSVEMRGKSDEITPKDKRDVINR